MNPYKRYVVTRDSDDKTFLVGDKFKKICDDTIICKGLGFLLKEDVEAACKGMEFEEDLSYNEELKQQWLELGKQHGFI